MMTRLVGPRVADLDLPVFMLAVILTPILYGLSGAILLGYGVFFTAGAAIMGLPAYLLGGIPAAALAISRLPERSGRASIGSIVGTGLCAHFVTTAIFAAILLIGPVESPGLVKFLPDYLFLGIIAAPLEALVFALIYRRFARVRSWRADVDVFA